MDIIIGLNKKEYSNIVAENYLCVPAVLETILKADGFLEIDMYEIANYFGVVLPNDISYSKLTNYSHSDNTKKQGIILNNDSINSFFINYKISLREKYVRINTIDKDFFSDFVNDVLASGKHIICGFEYHNLYGSVGDYSGHVSIIINVDLNKECMFLLDPGPKKPGVKKVSAHSLYSAISAAKDGLWIISND